MHTNLVTEKKAKITRYTQIDAESDRCINSNIAYFFMKDRWDKDKLQHLNIFLMFTTEQSVIFFFICTKERKACLLWWSHALICNLAPLLRHFYRFKLQDTIQGQRLYKLCISHDVLHFGKRVDELLFWIKIGLWTQSLNNIKSHSFIFS